MSSPVCQDFSGPVTCVPTVGNPITQRNIIDAANEKTFAGPVAKKPAPISWRLTRGVSKPRDVVDSVIVTFSVTLVMRPTAPKTTQANQRPVSRPPCAFVDVAVRTAANRMWASKPLNGISATTWIVLPAREYVDGKTHRCFIQRAPTSQEKKKKKRKRQRQGGPRAKRGAAAGLHTLQANDMEEDEEVDVDNDSPPLHVFFDIEAMHPTNSTSPIWSWPKLNTTIVPFVSQANIVSEIFSNGWLPSP